VTEPEQDEKRAERGAAGEAGSTPLAETEVSRRPPGDTAGDDPGDNGMGLGDDDVE
jgi:hypothetical protein